METMETIRKLLQEDNSARECDQSWLFPVSFVRNLDKQNGKGWKIEHTGRPQKIQESVQNPQSNKKKKRKKKKRAETGDAVCERAVRNQQKTVISTYRK